MTVTLHRCISCTLFLSLCFVRLQVSVVAFGTNANKPPGNTEASTCFNRQLASASPSNIKYLDSYIDGLNAYGSTFYRKALRAAFGLLKKTPTTSQRDKVILFLTDGIPSDSPVEIMESIKGLNKELNNTVMIVTYGLGEAASSKGTEILTSMAEQNGTLYEVELEPNVRKGAFIPILNPSELRPRMGLYYALFLKNTTVQEPSITIPYMDAWGLGVVTTVSLPLILEGQLKGVVGIDITMADLLSDVLYLSADALSYPFVIDNRGRVMMHPLLPSPVGAYEDPIFVDIRDVERNKNFLEVYDDMLKGKAGVKQLMAESIQSRGETLLEGVVVQKFPAMYYWRPISVVGYSLALVLVLEQHAKHSMLSPLAPSAGDFLYHRLDLIQSQVDTSQCRYFGNIAIKDRSTVKFAPDAFVDPYHYLDSNESNVTVRQYSQYMNDVTTFATNPGFKVRVSITASDFKCS
ncbi:PREDICTED: VWFA and cache domain-containing protein 1-like [Priapulus caudatus]|uniref:VWFA and cache domain-containing protein 1-like n=1 Tax=Priapulus caudatus TaxID=37621 RepID=A0ABM1EVV0_PRICU|nr:PREDICTED: VWFA and cache domain-containing protein 1-like [Priapulus caudatus]